MKEDSNGIQLPEYLLVHPELKDDPINKQGQIGFITAAVLNTDEFYVGFDDHEVGLYSADALLILKASGVIHDFIHQNALKLSVDDFKDLKNIALHLDYGTLEQQRKAIKIAKENPSVGSIALMSLEESLGINQTLKRSR